MAHETPDLGGVTDSSSTARPEEELAAVAALEMVQGGTYAELPKAPPLNEYVPPPSPSRWHRLGRGMTALCTAAVVGFGGAFVAPAETSKGDTAKSAAELYADKQLPPISKEAPQPSLETIELIGRLLAGPQNKHLTTFEEVVQERLERQRPTDHSDIREQRLYEIRQKVAGRYNLTVFNPTQTLVRLAGETEENPISSDERMEIVNDFLANYGLSMEVDATMEYASNQEAATPEALASGDTRYFFVDLVRTIATMPKEYIEATGIRRFLLTSQKPNTVMKAGGYIYPDLKGPIGAAFVLNLSAMQSQSYSTRVINHEFWHRWDYLLSGGAMDSDENFAATTQGAPYGKVGPEPGEDQPDTRPVAALQLGWLTLDDFQRKRLQAAEDFQPHLGQRDCQAHGKIADAKVDMYGINTVFVSAYSASGGLTEHKADTGSYIPQGAEYPQLLAPQLPYLRHQLQRELARLHTYYPRLARYFIDTAHRPSASDNPAMSDPNFFQNLCTRDKGGNTFGK